MKLNNITTKTFWKGEVGITGAVQDDLKLYQVRLEVKGSQVFGYSCSCAEGNSYKGMCKHSEFVFTHYLKQEKNELKKQVTTDIQVRAMIREYTNREVTQIRTEHKIETIDIIPKLLVTRKDIEVEFYLKRTSSYIIKNLVAFVEALEQGAYVEYGKKLAFHHDLSLFTVESQKIVLFLMEMVANYRENQEQFRKNTFGVVPITRTINLSKSKRDHFFQLIKEKQIQWQDINGINELVSFEEHTPCLNLIIQKEGRDGVSVALHNELNSFSGERHLYIKKGEVLYCCDEESSLTLAVFLEHMMQSSRSPKRVLIQDRDMPLFYERVLKKIKPYTQLEINDVDLNQYQPETLVAKFYFDSIDSLQITMTPLLCYGEYSFHPIDDVKVPRSICRDIPKEFRISQVITKYFNYRDHDQSQLIVQDETFIYDLVANGIAEFQQLGEVFLSDSCKAFKVLPAPKIGMAVRTNDRWLELAIDLSDINQQEFYQIITSYKKKQTYHRLKTGEFIQLDVDGMLAISQLIDQCNISKDQLLSNQISLPLYRALYLDSIGKENNELSFFRDNLFKSIVRGMKSVDDSDDEVPAELSTILRPYQAMGFRWLKTLDYYGFGGILADDMGLGKTLQIIALLLDEQGRNKDSVSLVVCPASLVYNWQHEINYFAPSLKVCTIAGSAKERVDEIAAISQYNVAITSYDLLKRDILYYQDKQFRFEIIDEAQAIKNATTQSAKAVKAIRAKTKLALTGTPIENHLGELWSIFDYLMTGFLFTYTKFKHQYEQPIVKENDLQAVKRLHQMVSPFILRRLKKDVLTELPDKLETTIYSKCEDDQKKIYLANAYHLKQLLEKNSVSEYQQGKIQILAELMKLRQICCDPRLYDPQYKGKSAKLETCMELLINGVNGGHKILLFSQFTSMLDLIGKRLEQEGIKFYLLVGATPKDVRMKMVQSFQKDSIAIFLISLKAGGTGLNLTAADMVIHYDPWWNVAAQNQATDRAHRIGQSKQVSVYQLIMKNTIEEQIIKLQNNKKQLADQIITEGGMSLSTMTKEDLINLLEAGERDEEGLVR